MLWFDYSSLASTDQTLDRAGGNFLDSGQLATAGQWQHLTGTCDGTTAKIYINGNLVASKAFSGNVGDSNTWRIGAYSDSPAGFFDGTIDEVRIYNRALGPNEVMTDMTRSVGRRTRALRHAGAVRVNRDHRVHDLDELERLDR